MTDTGGSSPVPPSQGDPSVPVHGVTMSNPERGVVSGFEAVENLMRALPRAPGTGIVIQLTLLATVEVQPFDDGA